MSSVPNLSDPSFEIVWELERAPHTPDGQRLLNDVIAAEAALTRARETLQRVSQNATRARGENSRYRNKLQAECSHRWVPFGSAGEFRCEGLCQSLFKKRKPRTGKEI